MPSPRSNRKSATEQRHNLIVNTAIDCFVKKGFHQTSIRDIAGKADISLGNFYNYFDSKDALIEEIAVIEAEEIKWVDALLEKQDSPIVLLKQFMNQYLCYVEQLPNAILAVEILAEAVRNPDIGKPYEVNRKKLTDAITQLIKQGIKSGEFNPRIDKKETSNLIIDAIDGLAMRSAFAGKSTSARSKKALHDLVLNSITV